MDNAWRSAGMLLCLAVGSAAAQPASETQNLRSELDALRKDYESRIQALEQRLKAAETALTAPMPAPAAVAAPGPEAAPAVAAAPPGRTQSGVTPDISLILSGGYNRTSRDPATYRIRGFSLPTDAETGPGTRGFTLGETELSLSASVDPYFRGVATFAIAPDDSIGVEEAYVQTTALGNGLTVKGGRFLSGIGYLNSLHPHSWDFIDAPLAYQALLGGQYGDDGLQFTWLAPTDRFVQLRAEVTRGAGYPGSDAAGNGAGAFTLSAHTGGDIGDSHSWRAGLSFLRARAGGQELGARDPAGNDIINSFTGTTRMWIADGVWRWAPGGNAKQTHFKLQGEYLQARREGDAVVDTEGAAAPGSFRSVQSGWYLQGVYQFTPGWRIGLRTERLRPGTTDYGVNAGLVGSDSGNPRKNTLLLEHSPSEFSRVRLQVAQDRARPGPSDLQWMLQYQMSLGAHGAHGF
ncbi:MAG: hypothetical protein EOO24_38830, partial [Comamonadaceae bacterium]